MAPLALGSMGLLLTDSHTSAWVAQNGTLPSISRKVSLGGTVYADAGAAGAFYLLGRAAHNAHARRTGVLMTEALVDTGAVTLTMKGVFGRERPNADQGRGLFFREGGRSFPSGHSSSAWAAATVVAYQYKDHPWIKYGAFAAATLVGLSRYSGRDHFLSEVLIGSSIGYGVGRYVYKRE